MKTIQIFLIPFLILFLSFGNNLNAQELTLEERKKKMALPRWGNEDLVKALDLATTGNAIKARPFFEKAALSFEKDKIWEGYLFAMRSMVYTHVGMPDGENGIEIGNHALKKIETVAPELLNKCDDFHQGMGSIYLKAGEFEKALNVYKKQLEIVKKHYPLDSNWRFGRAYGNIGIASEIYSEDRVYFLQKAINQLEQLELAEGEKGVRYKNSSLVSACSNLSYTYDLRGNLSRSIEYSNKAIEIMTASGLQTLQLIDTYYNVGLSYKELNEFDQSSVFFKKIINILEKNEVTDRVTIENNLVGSYFNIGSNEFNLGKTEDAFLSYQKALKLLRKHEIQSDYEISILIGLADIFSEKNEDNNALEQVEKAEKLYTTNEKNKFYGSIIKWVKGRLLKKQGKLEQAKKYYLKADELATDVLMVKEYIIILKELSEIYEQIGDQNSSFQYNQKAIQVACFGFESEDIFVLPKVDNLKYTTSTYKVLSQKASLLNSAASKENDTMLKEKYLNTALAVTNLLDDFHIANLKKINVQRGAQSSSLVEASILPYRKGVAIALDANPILDSQKSIETGFYFTQKMKAQQLWMSLLKSNAQGLVNLDPQLLEKERDLLSDINLYENKIFEARQNKDTASINLYENDYLFKTKIAYEAMLREMENQNPEFFASKYEFVPETEKSIQAILNEKELLIEYVFSGRNIFAFTISKTQPLQFIKIDIDEEMEKRIEDFKSMLQNSSMMRRSGREKFINLSHQLYQQFIQPIDNQLIGKERLIIIGDVLTNYIPFEALVSSDQVKGFGDLDYLIKNHEISYHYSSTLFAKARTKGERKVDSKLSGIYAFAPVYDNVGTASISKEAEEKSPKESTLRAFADDGSFSPLPESEVEVNAIMKLFNEKKNSYNSVLALRGKATEISLKNNMEKPFQFLHIAGHSFADLDFPKFSGIACYTEKKDEDDTDTKEDGTLYIGEIYGLSSKADLVTLSSCESGFGKLEGSEGLLGINRSFIYAGTPNVVFSLWKVYDKVSSELMVDFYENVLLEKDYAKSLRAAKLNLLKKETTAAPHFWAPYLLIGR